MQAECNSAGRTDLKVYVPRGPLVKELQAGSLRSPESKRHRYTSWSVQRDEVEFRNKSGMVGFD